MQFSQTKVNVLYLQLSELQNTLIWDENVFLPQNQLHLGNISMPCFSLQVENMLTNHLDSQALKVKVPCGYTNKVTQWILHKLTYTSNYSISSTLSHPIKVRLWKLNLFSCVCGNSCAGEDFFCFVGILFAWVNHFL